MPGASGAPAAAPSASAAGDEAAPDGEGEPHIHPRVPSVASKKWRRCRGGGAKKRKRISHARPRASGLAWPAPDPSSRAILFRISKIIQKVTNGIAGNVDGFDGSVNATGAACILRSLRAKGRIFVDLGCGYGWMMAAAFGMGAVASVGIELPVNIGQMRIYEGVINKMQEERAGFTYSFQQKHEFIHLDINEVFAVSIVSSPHSVTQSLGCCFLYWAVASHALRFPVRVCVLERNGSEDSVRDPASLREVSDIGRYCRLSRPQELDGLHGRCSVSNLDPFVWSVLH